MLTQTDLEQIPIFNSDYKLVAGTGVYLLILLLL